MTPNNMPSHTVPRATLADYDRKRSQIEARRWQAELRWYELGCPTITTSSAYQAARRNAGI